ncbi:MAG: hypothetical protein DMG88_14660 [Acidobacteria bacterium]|nr:MAG: hypothetical protein DMG88_14660 [Acidobacteriota bacterium]
MPVYPGALRFARENEAAGAADATACPMQASSEILGIARLKHGRASGYDEPSREAGGSPYIDDHQ